MTSLQQEAQAGFEQCVVFVEHITGIGYGLPYARNYLNLPGVRTVASGATPKVGDIAIWGANQNQASSAGHVAIVTGLSPSGQATVTGTNWPEGSSARSMVLTPANYPTAFLTPSSEPNLQGATLSGALAPTADNTGGAANVSSFTSSGTYTTLQQAMSDTGFLHLGAVPAFFRWLSQGALLRRIGFTMAALVAIGVGIYLLTRRNIAAAPAQFVANNRLGGLGAYK